MIAPAKRFRETAKEQRWNWNDTVATTMFTSAAEAALAQMAINNSSPPDMGTAASFQWRMEGAKQFLTILTGLAESERTAQPDTRANLNHDVFKR